MNSNSDGARTILSHPPNPPIELDPGHCLLFAYGQLQPGHRAPRTIFRGWPDRVRGLLYDLGRYPAAIEIAKVDRRFQGFVLEIDETELVHVLDPYEELDQVLYRRIRTMTEAGFEAWIYEYTRPLPANAVGPIDRWGKGGC